MKMKQRKKKKKKMEIQKNKKKIKYLKDEKANSFPISLPNTERSEI
jgi:hypothetical protein